MVLVGFFAESGLDRGRCKYLHNLNSSFPETTSFSFDSPPGPKYGVVSANDTRSPSFLFSRIHRPHATSGATVRNRIGAHIYSPIDWTLGRIRPASGPKKSLLTRSS
jgi:hypothetical protein